MKKTLRWLLLCLGWALPAWAMGPVLTVGGGVTLRQSATDTSGTTVTFNNLAGPVARAGFELGDRWNHEIAFQWSLASGEGGEPGVLTHIPVSIMTFSGRYTFTVDLFTKEGLEALPGFTPFVGGGLCVGAFQAQVQDITRWGPYLELHATVGARYTLKNGLGFRLEVVGSTYGGFFAVQPSLGVGYRF